MSVRRVALVSPYALSVYGGVQEQILSMSRVLSDRGVEVLVVAPDNTDHAHHETPATVRTFGRLISLPANGSRAPLTLSPVAARAATKAVQQFDPDVVHLHEPFAPVLGYDLLRTHKYAAVGTFHRSGGGPAFRLTGPLLRALRRGIDHATAVSEAASTTILKAAGVNTVILFNGFETERFREFDRVVNETPTIFFIGRLEPRKGIGTLLEVARRRLARGAPPWKFVVAGDGAQREAVVQVDVAAAGVQSIGAIDDETKRRWLRQVDVVVAPSTHGESFGLVLLEAMASETPIVASDIDGYREAAAGYAQLFSPNDPEQLEMAIERALKSSTTETLSARRHAEQWSMEHLIDQYCVIYEEARDRHRRSR